MSEYEHVIEAINERLDGLDDLIDAANEDTFIEITELNDQIRELQNNMTSVISMFTQMNISLLQIQSDVLENKGKTNG